MKKRIFVLLFVLLAMVLTLSSCDDILGDILGGEPEHECERKCPECGKCIDEDCMEGACAEKCEEHGMIIPPHGCVNVCSECGKCTNASCNEAACTDKCQGHVPPHTCENVCPKCGNCTDATCNESVCEEKCEGHLPIQSNEYNIVYEDLDGWLIEGYFPNSAKEGDTVILRANPIMDADLELYVNGEKINQTYADYDYWEYVFTMPAEDVTVTKKVVEGFLPDPGVGDIEVTLAEAGFETIYFEWKPLEGADGYKVYCDTKPVDNELIRFYGTYYRCDVLGLTAAAHNIEIVPVKGGEEIHSSKAEFITTPAAHVREGFAFVGNGDANGAYNSDGTLKPGAVVLYVTNENKDTISLTMKTDSKATETKVGIQNILLGLKKGYYEHPLCIRFIGNITDPAVLDKGDLLVDINKGAFAKGLTIEGVGNDATFNGFGLRLKGAKNVEIRNLAFMNCDSNEGDNVSLASDNYHIWIHNCDFFYGDAGSDADQAKGDGALDTKVSQYISYSYNHFWDCGKVHLNGNKDTTVNYITYHHNWYDHCDSRMPRVRVSNSIHVYNNFYDGVSKYGIGATMGCSIFSEANYFLNTTRPMMISKQGTDALGEGTFSGEPGGMIKSYGDLMVFTDNSVKSNFSFIPYSQNKTSFDAYVASSRNELVPGSVVALSGGTAYSNFDTSSDMYSYKVQSAEDARDTVVEYAGRVQGGDFKWSFTDKDNSDYNVNSALKSALKNYKSSLVSVGGIDAPIGGGNGNEGGNTNQEGNTNQDGNTENGGTGDVGTTSPSTQGVIVHNFHESGKSSSFFTINGNLSKSKGTIEYDGKQLTQCLKIESSTSISFTMAEAGTIALVFNPSASCKIDGQKYTSETNIITVELEAGQHTITKADSTNLYYIIIEH